MQREPKESIQHKKEMYTDKNHYPVYGSLRGADKCQDSSSKDEDSRQCARREYSNSVSGTSFLQIDKNRPLQHPALPSTQPLTALPGSQYLEGHIGHDSEGNPTQSSAGASVLTGNSSNTIVIGPNERSALHDQASDHNYEAQAKPRTMLQLQESGIHRKISPQNPEVVRGWHRK